MAFPSLFLQAALPYQPRDTGATFANIPTSKFRSINTRRGRSSQLDNFSSGFMGALLDNRGRDYDAYDTGGPNYGTLKPNRQARFVVQHPAPVTYPIFRGYTGGFPLDFALSGNDTVTLSCTDGFESLAQAKLFGAGIFPQELSGARINRILNVGKVSWPAALRDIDVGASLCAAGDYTQKSALDAMQQVAATEGALLFIDVLGQVKFVDRNALATETVYTTSQATFGDGGGSEVPYQELKLDPKDKSQIRNDLQVALPDFDAATAGDSTSQNEYGTFSHSIDGVDASPFAAQATADNLLAFYKDPKARVLNLKVKLHRADALYDAVLPLDLGHRVTVRKRPKTGPMIEGEFFIDSIAHEVTPKRWTVTFTLGLARDTRAWAKWDTALWDDSNAQWGW